MRADSKTPPIGGIMCAMVHCIEFCIMNEVESPRRVDQTRPGNSNRYHLPSAISSGTRVLGGCRRLGHEGPVRAFPLAPYAGRECVVPVDLDNLAILVTPVARGRAALTSFPSSVRTERAISAAVDVHHLLS